MKPKHFLRTRKTMIALLSGAIFFASCKKEGSVETPELNSDQLTETATDASDSTTVSAAATTAYEGFGSGAVGGANSSTVYHVTNLNSSGAGSLANGIGSNRTIVFDVSGTIKARLNISNVSYLTIDATGKDITIDNNNNGDGISIGGSNTHHIVLKGLRVTNAGNDGINVVDGAHDIVITNCTSWGNRDGNIDIASGYNVTVQYCILGKGASGWSGDMLITAKSVSVHHNLFSPSTSGEVGERCPLIHANYSSVGSPNADFRNNLVWKWGRNGGTGSGYGSAVAYKATANFVNNYYYSGVSQSNATIMSDYGASGTTGYGYAAGNVSGNSGVNPNSTSNASQYAIPSSAQITMQDACTAAALVLANAGPSPRTAADNAILSGITLPGCSTTTPPPTTNTPPTVSAGANQTITLPTNSVTLTGTASDADGSIASYQWTKVSGGSATIASPSSKTTSVSGLVAGTYVFNLKVTDNGGASANASVTVTVKSASNTAPTVSAGANQTITLPANSVTLTGTAADTDGSIASYQWTKVSGGSATIASPTSRTTNVSGLVAGTYVFNLKVTDNGGASANANVTVTVNSATNTPPTVSAGSNQTITLPTSSVTLTGTASDPNGSIVSYAWTKVSGGSAVIASPAARVTSVTGLVAGTYVFNLKVTDNGGASANANVTVTVNPAVTTPPPTSGNVTFTQGYDASNTVNTNAGKRNSWSTSIKKSGTGSFKSEVNRTDYRGEMIYSGSDANPTEAIIEYDVYYQNWSNISGSVGSTIMWQPSTSGASAVLGLQNYDGKFKVVRAIGSTVTAQSGSLKTVQSNKWYKMRWEVKWSSSTNGYIRLYIDDVLYYSYNGKTTDASGTPTLRVGQYTWGMPSGSTAVVYYDNVKVSRK